MPRNLQEIIDHANELAKRFEDYDPQPGDHRDPAELIALRDAVALRAKSEYELAEAVLDARDAGHSWATIASLLGISGEAARQKYGQLTHH